MESFGMWWWWRRRVEKNSQTDCVRNEEMLCRVKKERNIIRKIK